MISQVCFVAGNSIICRAAVGRPLPTADVGYPVAQVGCQLSGGEIARPTGASRPIAARRVDPKQPDGEQSLFLFRFCEAAVRDLTDPAICGCLRLAGFGHPDPLHLVQSRSGAGSAGSLAHVSTMRMGVSQLGVLASVPFEMNAFTLSPSGDAS